MRLLAGVLLLTLLAPPALAQAPGERVAGDDRYGTAAAVSAASFAPGVAVAYLAVGTSFADALAAGAAGGPVLLTQPAELPEATRDELVRLRPERVVLLGGEQAVAVAVEEALRELVGEVERVAGSDRYGTAAALSAATFDPGVEVAFVASGAGFADGLAASAAAGFRGGPVLLVDPAGVPAATRAELARLRPAEIVVAGGEQAVPDALLDDLGAPARRVAGDDRYATAAAVAADTFPAGAPVALLASGADFPDALAGAAAAAAQGGPVLLVRPDCLPAPVDAELGRLAPGRTLVLGGSAAVGDPLEPCGLETTVLATGLDAPWDVAFAPDGTAFITENNTGRLLARTPDGVLREVQRLAIDPEGEGGLLGVAVSPRFAEDGLLYAYLTTPGDNRIVRFRAGGPPEPLLTGIPAGRVHNGGRLAFGPDGMLYATTGDAGESARSQDPASLGGKILRLTPDGGVPADNPLPGSPVYALGLRNSQGLAWDAAGRLFASEFGPDRDDEVNLITPGGNYGWPEVTGAAGRPEFVDPFAVRQPVEAAWSGAAILGGDLYVAALRGQRLWRFDLADGSGEALLTDQFGRLRDVTVAPDGSLWLLTSNRDGRTDPDPEDDRLLRLAPG